ncbi:hypothetical protein SBRCBS47491_000167 [Sporothrix bragantina]|uniref:Uncharacterized protein n=1 Tax=Sporothrix bragantina TaxID=671064 RepID=A0ABP0AN36_9PEZI
MLSRASTMAATASSRASSISLSVTPSCPQRRESFPCMPFSHAAVLHIRSPRREYLDERYFAVDNWYERLATGNTHAALGIVAFDALEQHTGTVYSSADFVPVHGFVAEAVETSSQAVNKHASSGAIAAVSRFLGGRPKLATWPLNKKETVRHNVQG